MNKKTIAGIAGILLASNVGTGLAIDGQNKAERELSDQQFRQAKLIMHTRFKAGNLSHEEANLWVDVVSAQQKKCKQPLSLSSVNNENLADKLNDTLLKEC